MKEKLTMSSFFFWFSGLVVLQERLDVNQALMEETLIKQQQEMEEDQRWLEQEESHMVMKLTQKAVSRPDSGP